MYLIFLIAKKIYGQKSKIHNQRNNPLPELRVLNCFAPDPPKAMFAPNAPEPFFATNAPNAPAAPKLLFAPDAPKFLFAPNAPKAEFDPMLLCVT